MISTLEPRAVSRQRHRFTGEADLAVTSPTLLGEFSTQTAGMGASGLGGSRREGDGRNTSPSYRQRQARCR
jgi:hypothetical protein